MNSNEAVSYSGEEALAFMRHESIKQQIQMSEDRQAAIEKFWKDGCDPQCYICHTAVKQETHFIGHDEQLWCDDCWDERNDYEYECGRDADETPEDFLVWRALTKEEQEAYDEEYCQNKQRDWEEKNDSFPY